MILGSKPFNSLTPDEMQAAIEELRQEREALRNEALKDKAVREAKGMAPREKTGKVGRPAKKNEADALAKQMLDFMRSEAE